MSLTRHVRHNFVSLIFTTTQEEPSKFTAAMALKRKRNEKESSDMHEFHSIFTKEILDEIHAYSSEVDEDEDSDDDERYSVADSVP